VSTDRDPKTGTIEFGRYQAVLAGTAMITDPSDPTFANTFQPGVENTLVVQAGAGNFFKGLLVIASGGNADDIDSLDTKTPKALTISDEVRSQVAPGCAEFDVAGITHTSNNEKRSLGMRFQWPRAGEKLFLDVNIVKTNNSTSGSEYYFTQYPMQAGTSCDARRCGLLRLGIFCPLTLCGLFGRTLGLCNGGC
jgi:hypothetical protein